MYVVPFQVKESQAVTVTDDAVELLMVKLRVVVESQPTALVVK